MMARIRKATEDKDQGFTLIELLVVMIIIGILAAIAVPVFLNQRTKAVDTSIKSDLKNVASNVEAAAVDSQTYSTTGIDSTTSATASSIVIAGATVALTAGNNISYRSDGTVFCLRGYNGKSNANSATNAYWYVNTAGGFQTAIGTKPTACPAFS